MSEEQNLCGHCSSPIDIEYCTTLPNGDIVCPECAEDFNNE